MKHLYLFLALLHVLNIQAQQTTEIDNLNNSAETLLNSDPRQAMQLAEKAHSSAQTEGYANGMNRSTTITGIAQYKIDRYDKARIYFDEAIKSSTESPLITV